MKIFRLPTHWFYLFPATTCLLGTFGRAAKYFQTRALHDLQLPHPETLTSKELRRLKHYFYGTTYLATIFCLLRGRRRDEREKHRFTNLAALAYFFDDLVDTFRPHDTGQTRWQNNPEHYGQHADERGLARHFLDNVQRELPLAELAEFKTYMNRVFNVETAGRQQRQTPLTINDLEKITAEKGGCSVLLFRRMLNDEISEAERDALFQFGYLIQLCDDIFDLWFDRQTDTQTVPLALANDLPRLTQVFENQYVAVKFAFRKIPRRGLVFGPNAALAAVHFVVTTARVCLAHYRHLEKLHGHLPLDDRHRLVLDMERWPNRLRAVWLLISEI